MSNDKQAPSKKWHHVDKLMPETPNFDDTSDYLLCLSECGCLFTGWYNSETQHWFNADTDTSSKHTCVIWWRPMIKLPKGVTL